ncbi:hypothetical protein MASR2M36_11080 [Providencia sp.]
MISFMAAAIMISPYRNRIHASISLHKLQSTLVAIVEKYCLCGYMPIIGVLLIGKDGFIYDVVQRGTVFGDQGGILKP